MKCWLCEQETGIKETDYGDHRCPKCGVMISIYNPADYVPLENEEEEMANVNDLNKYITHTDVTDGDIITFVDAGELIEKDFSPEKDESDIRTVLDITITLPSGKKKLYSPNKTTRTALSEVWGAETENWVGKKATVSVVKQNVGGNLKKVIYLEPVK